MGRTKLGENVKRKLLSITLDEDVVNRLEYLKIKNKSQLINRLLKEHFNLIETK